MNPEPEDVDPHQYATGLIPWYVNGTLDGAEAAKLGAHLDVCAPCRRDYEAQVRLFEAMQPEATLIFAAEPSFRKLMARIGTGEDAGEMAPGRPSAAMPVAAAAPARTSSRVARWLAAAVVLEGLGLGYGGWAWHANTLSTVPAYFTLTSSEPSYRDSARVRIVFRSTLSVQDLGRILHDAGAHIIDGPTDSNVYTLGFTGAGAAAGAAERRLAALRANADVLFAEPLGAVNASR
ncbi:MAG TPA: zf-HC2 domain-containing protein [Steroidobacteraceae bacterium]|nr:zf-HC2 domain-containing protein [Steroidobacteraceae bacterium]